MPRRRSGSIRRRSLSSRPATSKRPESRSNRAMRNLLLFALLGTSLAAVAQTPDWSKVNEEAMRHYQALVRIDSTDPPGNETHVVEYLKKVLEAEGIPVIVAAKDPARANIIARLKG